MRFLLVLFSLWLCLSFVQTALSDNNVTVQSADFQATVQTDIFGYPQWLFSQNDNSSYLYKVTLVAMWETENTTDYDYVAGSYTQTNANFRVQEAGVDNFRNVSVMSNSSSRYEKMALNTRIPMWAVNGSSYPAGKFDVELTNYKWVSMASNAQLVLAFVLNYELDAVLPSLNLSSHGSRTFDFSGAYFSINSTAMGGSDTPNTSLSVAIKLASDVNTSLISYSLPYNKDTIVLVIYDHFEASMLHDPEFGFGTGPGNGYIWIIIIVVVVIAIIVIILIAVIGFILVRRRRRSYDAF